MFDFGIGTSELVFIAILALIVVGPKELPGLLRTIGRYVTKVKDMAREFQGHLEDAAKETGVDDLKSDFQSATEIDIDIDEEFKRQEAEMTKVFEDAAALPDEEPVKKPAAKKPAAKKPRKTTKKPAKKAAKKPAKTTAKKPARKTTARKKPAKKAGTS